MTPPATPPSAGPTVFVVDDEEGMRYALHRLLKGAGISARTFASAAAFLDTYTPEQPGCLLLDVNMPGMSGPELHELLAQRSIRLPIIYLTGFANVPLAVGAMKAGAVDFLEKPFDREELLDHVGRALELDRRRRQTEAERQALRRRLASLTPRERQVLDQLVAGRPNKEIARSLTISVRTVEIHRARVMLKIKADSLADLVRLVLQAAGAQTE